MFHWLHDLLTWETSLEMFLKTSNEPQCGAESHLRGHQRSEVSCVAVFFALVSRFGTLFQRIHSSPFVAIIFSQFRTRLVGRQSFICNILGHSQLPQAHGWWPPSLNIYAHCIHLHFNNCCRQLSSHSTHQFKKRCYCIPTWKNVTLESSMTGPLMLWRPELWSGTCWITMRGSPP